MQEDLCEAAAPVEIQILRKGGKSSCSVRGVVDPCGLCWTVVGYVKEDVLGPLTTIVEFALLLDTSEGGRKVSAAKTGHFTGRALRKVEEKKIIFPDRLLI